VAEGGKRISWVYEVAKRTAEPHIETQEKEKKKRYLLSTDAESLKKGVNGQCIEMEQRGVDERSASQKFRGLP
jgi:hypothetical protein